MKANYIVQIGDRELQVSVHEDGTGFRVEIDGEPVAVDDGLVRGGPTRSLLIEGRSYETSAMASRDGMDVYVSGDVYHLRVTDELRARVEAAVGGPGTGAEEIVSPMPGAVIAIPVSPGDLVVPGQTVAIVEAMKMQNEITAIGGGRVTEIRVKPGDVVEPDAVLVILAPEETDG